MSRKNRQNKTTPARLSSGLVTAVSEPERLPSLELKQLRVRQQYYEGPIPDPGTLREFESIVPGSAARIIAMAERQLDHRTGLESKALHHEIIRSYCGLGAGLVVSLTALVGGLILAYADHPWVGGSIGTGGIVALTGVFVYGTRSKSKERIEKTKIMAGQSDSKAEPPSAPVS